ncbi:PREDICTED: adenylate [Prunus dulcis]|uniref:adenylate dimethylallyltransferase (ADP/ATP-dependent) n=1 Tax=Prunus dulcis TaxID=3755 RepID=A0A5E4ER87_PRUDU|nr:adenylate isopentenyltransferase-like [Prunus dulcis]XP_034199626.1 adenylate isopentenyltransferase-like [Prunus dulcis]VVA17982.1 PREDICTED: adenylate [Prunus dulcis]
MTLHPFPTHSHHHYSNLNFNLYSYISRFHLLPPVNHLCPTTPSHHHPLPHNKPRRWAHMASGPTTPRQRQQQQQRKDKLLIIMGATGAGKSRLSLDLATRFPSFEIVNSDKMQLYAGLDITTNKLPIPDRLGVPHHLLGEFDPRHGDFTPSQFRAVAGQAISSITNRRKVPMLVGGSNSFIHALLVDRFEPGSNVFEPGFNGSVSSELRYNCCFLWVDVSLAVLTEYLCKRVDEMLDSGMLDELAEFCDPDRQDEDESTASQTALRKAIGVPEFTRYFKRYPPQGRGGEGDDRERRGAYEEAVRAIKDNTCQLAKRQIGKILRLKGGGWELQRLDATDAFRAVVATTSSDEDDGKRWSEIWERQVVKTSVKVVKRFLEE